MWTEFGQMRSGMVSLISTHWEPMISEKSIAPMSRVGGAMIHPLAWFGVYAGGMAAHEEDLERPDVQAALDLLKEIGLTPEQYKTLTGPWFTASAAVRRHDLVMYTGPESVAPARSVDS